MRAVLTSLILCSAFALSPARAAEPSERDHRARQGVGRGRRLHELPHRRSRKTFRRGKAHRYAVRRDLFAQPHAGPRHGNRQLEQRGFLSRAALWRGAEWIALLSRLPLSVFLEDDARRYFRGARLSRDACAGFKPGAAARPALSLQFSRADAGLEFPVLPAGHSGARPEPRAPTGTGAAIWSRGSAIAAPATRRRTSSVPTGAATGLRAASSTAGSRHGSMAPSAAD